MPTALCTNCRREVAYHEDAEHVFCIWCGASIEPDRDAASQPSYYVSRRRTKTRGFQFEWLACLLWIGFASISCIGFMEKQHYVRAAVFNAFVALAIACVAGSIAALVLGKLIDHLTGCRRRRIGPSGMVMLGIALELLVVLGVVVSSTGGKLPALNQFDFDGQSTLNIDERAAWERTRAQWDKKSQYVYCLVGIQEPKWHSGSSGVKVANLTRDAWQSTCSHTPALIGDGFSGGEYINVNGIIGPTLTPDDAAEALALKPEIQACVIVDLFAQQNPGVVAWYRSDGRGAKKFNDAPSLAIRESFARHMLTVQHAAGR